jgi:hypothetical protein
MTDKQPDPAKDAKKSVSPKPKPDADKSPFKSPEMQSMKYSEEAARRARRVDLTEDH